MLKEFYDTLWQCTNIGGIYEYHVERMLHMKLGDF